MTEQQRDTREDMGRGKGKSFTDTSNRIETEILEIQEERGVKRESGTVERGGQEKGTSGRIGIGGLKGHRKGQSSEGHGQGQNLHHRRER